MNTDIITELRSAAATLRTPTGGFLPLQDRVTAELLERAAGQINDYKLAAEAEAAQVDRLTEGLTLLVPGSGDTEVCGIVIMLRRKARLLIRHAAGLEKRSTRQRARKASYNRALASDFRLTAAVMFQAASSMHTGGLNSLHGPQATAPTEPGIYLLTCDEVNRRRTIVRVERNAAGVLYSYAVGFGANPVAILHRRVTNPAWERMDWETQR